MPFWSDVWRVLRWHPAQVAHGFNNLAMSAVGAESGMSAAHVVSLFWLMATALSLVCSRTATKVYTPWKPTIHDPWACICTPLVLKITLYLSRHCPFFSAYGSGHMHNNVFERHRTCVNDPALRIWRTRGNEMAQDTPPATLTFFAPCSSSTPSPITTYTTFLPNLWIILSKQLSFPNEQK